MWIKLIILVVTLFLLYDENFKVVNQAKKRNRKKIVLTILVVLSILSIIDVVIEVNEGNALVEKANKIIIQSDSVISNTNSIITDLEKNINSLEETGQSIIGINSALKDVKDSISGQVEILKKVVYKSKELVKFEEQKFQQDEAKIVGFTSDMSIINNEVDSTLFVITFGLTNKGQRTAIDVKIKTKVLFYKNQLDKFVIQKIKDDDFYFPIDLAPNTKSSSRLISNFTKENILKNYDHLILIIKSDYKDRISNKQMHYIGHFILRNLKSQNNKFDLIGDRFAEKINNTLSSENLEEYLIELKDN